MSTLTRRDLLRMSAAAGACALLPRAFAQEFGGFKMGMESYSVRNFDLDKALAMYKELGIPYAEIFADKHMPFTADAEKIKGYKAKLEAAGVTAWGFWGGSFPKDAEKSRGKFAFAKAMGTKLLVGDPEPDSFDALEALSKEYGVRVAIHNHGPKTRYDKIADLAKALDGRSENIGTCVDTGHYIRTGEDPVAALKQFGSRVLEVHLKDASAPTVFNVLGQGKLDLLGTFRALKAIKFDGCMALEYEEKPENPMDDLKACLAKVRDTVKQL